MREGLLPPIGAAGHHDAEQVLDVAHVVDAKMVGEDQLADLLAREAGSVVIDLDQGTLETEAVALLGPSLARKSLAVPVALEPGAQAIQVAFANPLDTGTMAAIAASTGCEVRALVATVTAIRRALDREYGPEQSPTKVIGARRSSPPPADRRDLRLEREASGEFAQLDRDPDSTEQPIASESTRRLAEQGPVTLPLHHLESEASLELRFEALLLALVEKGAIDRGDYADALRRLLRAR